MRRYDLYLEDILEAIKKIKKYTKNIDFKEFCKDSMLNEAVIRNLEIIGEAVKNVPKEIKEKYPSVE